MKLATTTYDFYSYCPDVIKRLDYFDNTGFKYLDFNFDECGAVNFWLGRDDYLETAAKIAARAQEKGYKFVQSHAPSGNGLCFDANRDWFMEMTKRSIRACKVMNINSTVVHAGYCGAVSMEEFCEKNKAFYNELLEDAEKSGVYLLIENSMPYNMGDNTYFFHGSEMKAFIEYVGNSCIQACWDTGHANPVTDQYSNIVALGSHLKAVHVQDNFGEKDDHIAPFQGTLNLDELMCALTDAKYGGSFTFEAPHILRGGNAWPVYRKKFQPSDGRTEKLFSPPLQLKIEGEKLLYLIGKTILEAYGEFEG